MRGAAIPPEAPCLIGPGMFEIGAPTDGARRQEVERMVARQVALHDGRDAADIALSGVEILLRPGDAVERAWLDFEADRLVTRDIVCAAEFAIGERGERADGEATDGRAG